MRPTCSELLTICALCTAVACSKSPSEVTDSQERATRAAESTESTSTGAGAPETHASSGDDTATPTSASASAATTSGAGQVEQGRQLYERYCRLCHGEGGKGYAADNAPSLVSKSFLESATDEFIARAVEMGRPNTAMAAYSKERGGPLTEQETAAIVAYIRSLGPAADKRLAEVVSGGDPKIGKQLYATQCQKCHGTTTERATALSLYNPELLAAATPAFLRHAIVAGRQDTPMPSFRGVLTERQIADIIAHLQTFAPKQPTPRVRQQVPDDLPVVINPKGAPPKFNLRAGRYVDSSQVNEALRQRRRIVIVDARSPADWIQFRIPGSIPVAYYDTESLARIPNDGTWVVAYCACPHHASGRVIDALRQRGYKNTAVLDEGILHWKQHGYPIEGEAVTKDDSP